MNKQIFIPGLGAKMNTLSKHKSKSFIGGSSFLLDNGTGGQSSYNSIDEYYETVKQPVIKHGRGLDDKVFEKLSKLNIEKNPSKIKRKNIVLSL